MLKRIFTSESVTEGHPDKVCDQISDGVLDAILSRYPMARVACETLATTGMVLVTGEISTNCYVDIARIARETLNRIGYNSPEAGFNGNTCAVLTTIHEQSADIAMGVNNSYDDDSTNGAGDQGMMFGFACDETKELMPAPISYAHNLSKALSVLRKDGSLPWLRPDGKSQVSVQYDDEGNPERIDTVVVSTQHAEDIDIRTLREAVIETVIRPNLPKRLLDGDTKFYVNPTGRFVLGGPAADVGLTGRKIIVDTYGGYAAHGGGAFSGNPPPIWPAILPRTSWLPAWPGGARLSWPMPSAWPSRSLSWWTASAPAACPTGRCPSWCAAASTCGPPPSLRP